LLLLHEFANKKKRQLTVTFFYTGTTAIPDTILHLLLLLSKDALDRVVQRAQDGVKLSIDCQVFLHTN